MSDLDLWAYPLAIAIALAVVIGSATKLLGLW